MAHFTAPPVPGEIKAKRWGVAMGEEPMPFPVENSLDSSISRLANPTYRPDQVHPALVRHLRQIDPNMLLSAIVRSSFLSCCRSSLDSQRHLLLA